MNVDGDYLAVDAVRHEPDYADQVPRMASWKHAHPTGEFIYLGRWWQYFIAYENGFTAVGAASLRELLDKLDPPESLGAEPVSHDPAGA